MKLLVILLAMFCLVLEFHAQDSPHRIKRSNLGSSGSSITVENSDGNYQISQSIGQSSVIGTYHNNGYYLRQGYQQPDSDISINSESDTDLIAMVYPNPFTEGVFVSFNETIHNDITVQLFDVNARIIHSQSFLPTQKIELQLRNISSGTYFLKVVSDQKYFNTKLIKI